MSGSARSRALVGAGAAVLASVCFTFNDTMAKLMSGQFPLMQLILLWTICSLLFLMFLVVPLTGGLAGIRMRRPLIHLVRSLLVLVMNFCFFLAVASMPLADAVAIFFVAPLLITGFSVLFLREKVAAAKWVAVGIGLVGVLMISRPGTEAFQAVSLLPLAAALAYAGMQTLTRVVAATDSATALTLATQISSLVVCGLGGIWLGDGHLFGAGPPALDFLLRPWIWPTLADLGAFMLLGLSGAVGGTLISQAYRIAPGALVGPFEYTALPLSLLSGLMVFGDWPDGIALAGMGLILLAGLVAIWRDARVALDASGRPA